MAPKAKGERDVEVVMSSGAGSRLTQSILILLVIHRSFDCFGAVDIGGGEGANVEALSGFCDQAQIDVAYYRRQERMLLDARNSVAAAADRARVAQTALNDSIVTGGLSLIGGVALTGLGRAFVARYGAGLSAKLAPVLASVAAKRELLSVAAKAHLDEAVRLGGLRQRAVLDLKTFDEGLTQLKLVIDDSWEKLRGQEWWKRTDRGAFREWEDLTRTYQESVRTSALMKTLREPFERDLAEYTSAEALAIKNAAAVSESELAFSQQVDYLHGDLALATSRYATQAASIREGVKILGLTVLGKSEVGRETAASASPEMEWALPSASSDVLLQLRITAEGERAKLDHEFERRVRKAYEPTFLSRALGFYGAIFPPAMFAAAELNVFHQMNGLHRELGLDFATLDAQYRLYREARIQSEKLTSLNGSVCAI